MFRTKIGLHHKVTMQFTLLKHPLQRFWDQIIPCASCQFQPKAAKSIQMLICIHQLVFQLINHAPVVSISLFAHGLIAVCPVQNEALTLTFMNAQWRVQIWWKRMGFVLILIVFLVGIKHWICMIKNMKKKIIELLFNFKLKVIKLNNK